MSGRRGLTTVHSCLFQVGQSLYADRWLPVSSAALSRTDALTSTRHQAHLDCAQQNCRTIGRRGMAFRVRGTETPPRTKAFRGRGTGTSPRTKAFRGHGTETSPRTRAFRGRGTGPCPRMRASRGRGTGQSRQLDVSGAGSREGVARKRTVHPLEPLERFMQTPAICFLLLPARGPGS